MRKNTVFTNLQKGQALLVVVLVMVVALTIGLSIAARTIINLRSSTEEENSERAFSAAEAGLERALVAQTAGPISDTTLGNNAQYSALITPLFGQRFLVNDGSPIVQDSGADIWFVDHNGPNNSPRFNGATWDGTLRISWGTIGLACNAAIEVIVLQGSLITNATSVHYAFDPCTGGGASRQTSNNFSTTIVSPGETIDGKQFAHMVSIPNIVDGMMARVIPLYQNETFGVTATRDLPEQGRRVSSTGSVGLTGGPEETKRKITVFKGWPRLPDEYFQYVIFQPNP